MVAKSNRRAAQRLATLEKASTGMEPSGIDENGEYDLAGGVAKASNGLER
jgi:hypothetical protein